MVCEYFSDEGQALDSFCDALLVEEDNPKLNKNIENYYLSKKVLVKVILHWARYRENSPKGERIFLDIGAAKVLFSSVEDEEHAEA
ncbi:hypothetical protein N9L33_00110 [Nitrospinae bacterium]|jgi:hypothetical protein|nr:hypothetical protein [Nitrospinota bacterium]